MSSVDADQRNSGIPILDSADDDIWRQTMSTKFKNPSNGYVEEVSGATWFWCLIFGAFYFAFKGLWRHFVIGVLAAILTLGISWLIYPFLREQYWKIAIKEMDG